MRFFKLSRVSLIMGALAIFCWQGALANAVLPSDLTWLTNDTDEVYASPDAKVGGTFRTFVLSFPATLRTIGPDSNDSFRGEILSNSLGVIGIHPNTEAIVPALATHWAFGSDKRSMFFKIDPLARWSDGVPVTADDFLFSLEMKRSKNIVDPWFNDYYTKEIETIVKYDDHTIGIFAPKPKPDLHLFLALSPQPKHFYKVIDKDFPTKYNWVVVPNTGPYQITEVNKGKSIVFTRNKNWWAKDRRFFKNRFNVDRVEYRVIRDMTVAFEHFKKGTLDAMVITMPELWHGKAKGPIFDKGYVEKLWFYTDGPLTPSGLWLNNDVDILKDLNVRLGIQHAINVDQMIKTTLHGDYTRLPQVSSGYGKYTNPAVAARPFDLSKADGYFKSAGWAQRGPDGIRVKDGKRLSLTLSYPAPEYTNRLVVLKEEAKKAGLELNLKLMDATANYKMVMEKKHEIAFWGWSTNLRPEYWQGFHSDNAHKAQTNNITNTDNPELDRLIELYRNSIDEPDRIKYALEIQQLIHDQASFVPLYAVTFFRNAAWRYWRLPAIPATRLSGGAFDPFDSDTGGLFWFDAAKKAETDAATASDKTFAPVTQIDTTYRHKS